MPHPMQSELDGQMTDGNDLIRRDDAAMVLDGHDGVVARALGERICCNGQMCGCQGADVGSYLQYLIRALPAAPVHPVRVKPGAIERAVWSAMIWAASNSHGPSELPEYTDNGNSHAEIEARATAARILAAIEPAPAPTLAEALRLPKIAALVEAVSAEISARRTYEQTPQDRGGIYGPKGLAHKALRRAQGKTLATLRALEGGE